MTIKTLFKKRVYEYLFYRYLARYKNTKKVKSPNYITLEDFIKAIPSDFEEIVLVASGPSSKLLKKNPKHLYLCTNNSVDIVNDQSFIYFIQDYFFTLRYIKNHFPHKKWIGTFCLTNENGYEGNRKVHQVVKKMLTKFKRSQNELLISDVYKEEPFDKSYKEFDDFLIKTLILSTLV